MVATMDGGDLEQYQIVERRQWEHRYSMMQLNFCLVKPLFMHQSNIPPAPLSTCPSPSLPSLPPLPSPPFLSLLISPSSPFLSISPIPFSSLFFSSTSPFSPLFPLPPSFPHSPHTQLPSLHLLQPRWNEHYFCRLHSHTKG